MIIRIIKICEKSKILEFSCDACNKIYIKRQSNIDDTRIKHNFCSLDCKHKENAKFRIWTDEQRLAYSERFKGENNPNYNNKWTKEQRQIASEKKKLQYIERPELKYLAGSANRNVKFDKERIEKTHGNRTKESYSRPHSEESKLLIGKKSKEKWTPEYKEKNRKTRESLGHWIPYDKISEYKKYSRLSNWTCDMMEFFNEEELNNHNIYGKFNRNNTKGYVRDHIVSRYFGFVYNINYKIIRHPCNMRYISHGENISKRSKENKLMQFEIDYMIKCLISRIKNFNKPWTEHTECLEIIKNELGHYEN